MSASPSALLGPGEAASFTATVFPALAPGSFKTSWDFGDQSAVATGLTAKHAFASGGTYTVVFTLTEAAGEPVSATQIVTVRSAAVGAGRVFRGRVSLLSPFGPGESDPDTGAPAGWHVKLLGAQQGPVETIGSNGGYQFDNLPSAGGNSFRVFDVEVTDTSGAHIGSSNPGGHTPLYTATASPSITERTFTVGPHSDSFLIEGTVTTPTGILTTPPGFSLTVHADIYSATNIPTIVRSGTVTSNGFGNYRIETRPLPGAAASLTGSTTVGHVPHNPLTLTLSENGIPIDTIKTGVPDNTSHTYHAANLHG